MYIEIFAWTTVLAPLVGAVIAGFLGYYLKRTAVQSITLLGITIASMCVGFLDWQVFVSGHGPFAVPGFTWIEMTNLLTFKVGLWIDQLTLVMMTIVTFISLLVHLYSIGYMATDTDYRRYFSYISLFTFAMLVLVGADNCLQLFFGWEAVGFISYLLISFWFTKSQVQYASFKVFLINRVADFGLILGMTLLLQQVGSLEYSAIFTALPHINQVVFPVWGQHYSILTVISILLFIGAMGKSAQIPFQIWLPESMIGPTPVSALMHAATMVTAGVYMVARLSPLFEYSSAARYFIFGVGVTTALLFGLVALVQTDIKRVIAFSTISQLGYMTAGLGVSAYTAVIFHLATHACFKALLFLSAGVVIIALHHEQALDKMGGLWKRMPLTYICFLIGSLALIGLPPLSGFYSKDMILEAVYENAKNHPSLMALGGFYALLAGVFITSLYTSRLFFLVFHGDSKIHHHLSDGIAKPTLWMQIPLVILTFFSAFTGFFIVKQIKQGGWLGKSVVLANLHQAATSHNFMSSIMPIVLGIVGICIGWILYIAQPMAVRQLRWTKSTHDILSGQYGTEKFNQKILIAALQWTAKQFATLDHLFLDRWLIQGSAQVIKWLAFRLKILHTGYLHHYLLIMIISTIIILTAIIIHD